jgi:hypothetical protein
MKKNLFLTSTKQPQEPRQPQQQKIIAQYNQYHPNINFDVCVRGSGREQSDAHYSGLVWCRTYFYEYDDLILSIFWHALRILISIVLD